MPAAGFALRRRLFARRRPGDARSTRGPAALRWAPAAPTAPRRGCRARPPSDPLEGSRPASVVPRPPTAATREHPASRLRRPDPSRSPQVWLPRSSGPCASASLLLSLLCGAPSPARFYTPGKGAFYSFSRLPPCFGAAGNPAQGGRDSGIKGDPWGL